MGTNPLSCLQMALQTYCSHTLFTLNRMTTVVFICTMLQTISWTECICTKSLVLTYSNYKFFFFYKSYIMMLKRLENNCTKCLSWIFIKNSHGQVYNSLEAVGVMRDFNYCLLPGSDSGHTSSMWFLLKGKKKVEDFSHLYCIYPLLYSSKQSTMTYWGEIQGFSA